MYIGISLGAEALWQEAQKKYELENAKQLLDVDQMIEYILKLVQDKPCIYIYININMVIFKPFLVFIMGIKNDLINTHYKIQTVFSFYNRYRK